MSMTLIAPAIPALRTEFETSYNSAQLIITGFLAAMAIGLVFVGAFSDRFGRRPVLLWGALLFLTGSLLGYFASSISFVICARIIQGGGAAALMMAGRTIVNDLFSAKDASSALSAITAVQSIVPILSLAVGGLIVEYFGWRATFGIMGAASAIVFIQSYLLITETNHNQLSQLSITALIKALAMVLRTRSWQLYSLCAGLHVAVFYSMNGYMPYHFTRLGASLAEFGLYYSVVSLGYLFGNLANRRLSRTYDTDVIIRYGTYLSLLPLMAIWLADSIHILTPAMLSGLLVILGFSHGLVVANAIIGSLQNMGSNAGSANGLGAATHMVIGAIAGSIIISLGGANHFWVALFINLIMSLIALMAIIYVARSKSSK